MKVLHLAPTLQVGGTERFIERLAPTLAARHGVEQRVVALSSDGPAGEALRRAGISAEALSMSGPAGLLRVAWTMRTIVSDWRPNVVQTWLYVADLTGALATLGRPETRLVWNLRCSDAWLSIPSRTVRRVCLAIAGHAPDAIVACGQRAASFHSKLGYPSKTMAVIPNGYRFFAFDDAQRLRAQLRDTRASGTLVVGAAGRYDRAKGYGHLLAAVRLLRKRGWDVRLAMAGRGCEPANRELALEIAEHGMIGLVDLRGELQDLRPFFAGLDLFCLSSVSEGFPNALCEAIAEGVPAVATDVGDAAQIMGPDGTVPPCSPEALAQRMAAVLSLPRATRDERAAGSAARVRQTYDLDQVADQYYALYRSLMERPNAAES